MSCTSTKPSVHNPCPMLLKRMSHTDQGFFCQSCAKHLVDFRGKSTAEIKANSDASTCGIFTRDQLTPRNKWSLYRRAAFYGLTVLSFLGFNVKPLFANEAETIVSEQTEVAILSASQHVNVYNEESRTEDPDKKKKKKKNKKQSSKKQEFKTIGCPSF